jgi:alpha-mannosidase
MTMTESATVGAAEPYRAIVISETHWDRAWYVPFETFRIRLVRLIDRVLDILDRDPEFRSFMLDGQMSPIEDYLQIRPERRADLERHVKAGRLAVGPWYVLADEYLVSPESLIRNLMIGARMAKEFGGMMAEGYVPDAFGHINQLPQILAGMNLRSAVFWRGLGNEGEALGNEFWWQAPDGTRLLTLHLRDGYHNAANLGYPMRWGDTSNMEFDVELGIEQIQSAVELLKPHARTRNLLLMNGIDHAEAQPETPFVIRQANAALPGLEIEHNTIPEYVNRILADAPDLPQFEGEFNRGRYAVILQGVYSTRMYLKQANEHAQTLLERYAEPLSAIAWTLGAEHPAAFLDYAWRRLLQNHPHDDICGCSVDQVHRDNMVRYSDVEQVGGVIARDSFRNVVAHVNRAEQPGTPFVVFNPLAWPFTGAAELSLRLEMGGETAGDLHVVDAAGRPVAHQVLSRDVHFEMEVLKGVLKEDVRVALDLDALPPCGYRVYYARKGEGAAAAADPVATLPNGMENAHLRVEIAPDGSLDITDKAAGRAYHGLAYFEDTEDAGDEYDYSPARNSETIVSTGRTARARLLHNGPLQVTWEVALDLPLPAGLTADRQGRSDERVNCPITSQITLRSGADAVEVRTAVDNRAKDHRLRVCFPTDLTADRAAAGGHFDVVARAIGEPATEGWAQPPVPTKHQRGFVDISDGAAGLAVLNRGLPEYEALGDARNTVAVTLLRCVNAISRGDMLSRPSHAGIPCLAPEAQCQGSHTFEYAILPHAGDWRAAYRPAAVFGAPLFVRRGDETEGFVMSEVWPTDTPDAPTAPVRMKKQSLAGELPGEMSFVQLEPEALVLSAVKRAEAGDALIVRFYNPTADPVEAMLRFFKPLHGAWLANMAEEPQAALPIRADGSVVTQVRPKQVCTVRLVV